MPSQKTFSCCGHTQRIGIYTLIEDYTLNAKSEVASETVMNDGSKGTPKPATPQETEVLDKTQSHTNNLEIEEETPNNPIEELAKTQTPIFNCPNCGNQLNEYQTPCPSCMYEIEWK